jgi:hypothetical protein
MARIENSPIQQYGSGNLIQLIGNSINEGKPLAQCTIDELRAEKAWRQRLLQKERHRQWWLAVKLLAWLLTGGSATWLATLWTHWSHWLVLTTAVLGTVLPAMALHALSQGGDSEFAQRQRGALREIGHLLREKSGA